jgi:hypothetical protein
MELLSYISQLARRKETLQSRAQDLLSEHKTVEGMEEEMTKRNKALVARLKENRIRFSEFQRIAADETVTASAAGLMLGLKSDELNSIRWAEATKILIYLWRFFAVIEKAEKEGRLTEPTFLEWEDIDFDGMDEDELEQILIEEMGDDWNINGASMPASWDGVETRLNRYLSSPIYGAAAAGTMLLNQTLGTKQMMRVCRNDKRSCEDCQRWDGMGWQPIGSLPPPGQGCRCYDNCRCYIDYR